jgi:hypothetical protein
MAFKTNDRVYVNKGTHAGKYGTVMSVSGKTALVKFDKNYGGGSYYVGTDVLEYE